MKEVLLDVDMILDAMTDRKPFSEDAIQILDLCEKRIIKGYTTPVIISNLYYILRKMGTSHEQTLSNLRMLVSSILFDIVIIDKVSILVALNSGFADFEDALQNFSAESHPDISTIITRNTKDYKKSNLAVMTPKEFLGTLGV